MTPIMPTFLGLLLPVLPVFAQNSELPLKAGDRVALSVGGVLESDAAQISKVYSISDSGTINLVHVGEVKAAGLKPSALQRAIQDAYIKAEIYTKPVVNVTIDGGHTPDRMVYVVSGCRKNGPVAYNAGMTIMKAVSVAGGLNPDTEVRRQF
jgi:polysaccharide export outer membrane protein